MTDTTTENGNDTDDELPDKESWYENARATGFEEARRSDGVLAAVKLEIAADYYERGSDEKIKVGTDKFRLRATAEDGHKSLRVVKFAPIRDDEVDGLYYDEFPLFWEAVGELDARGFRVDTGAFEYAGP